MAVHSLDAIASPSSALSRRRSAPPTTAGAATRTRRNHGVFSIGDQAAAVYSSRRGADGLGVSMTVGQGAVMLTGSMTPLQARAMARALTAAAAAVEAVQGGRASA